MLASDGIIKICKQSFGGTKFENGFEKSKHLVN